MKGRIIKAIPLSCYCVIFCRGGDYGHPDCTKLYGYKAVECDTP
jgi:hypothetical protein